MTERELPAGWVWTTLGELGQWFGGGTPSKRKPEFWDSGTIPWLSPKDMGASQLVDTQDRITEAAVAGSATSLVPANSVALVVRSGILERRVPVSLVPFTTTMNQDMKAIVPHAAVDPKWLLYTLQSQEKTILHDCRKAGTTVASLDTAKLQGLQIPLPPLPEQHRIVEALEDHLSRLDAAVQGISDASARSATLRTSALRRAHARGARLGQQRQIGSVAETQLGKMLDSKKPTGGSPTPYLRNINVRWHHIDLADLQSVPLTDAEIQKFALRFGDVLACEGGEPGRCAVWDLEESGISFQKALHRIRPNGEVTSRWLALMLEEAMTSHRYDRLLTGTTIKHLPQEKLRRIEIPVPDVDVQNNLIDEFDQVESAAHRLGVAAATQRDRSAVLRHSLLRAAFNGELVDQDPTDEPSDVALAKIRDQQSGTAPRRRRKVVAAK